jgi:hypothetical protein
LTRRLQGAAKITVTWPAASSPQLPLPGTFRLCRQVQLGAVRHSVGVAGQRYDGVLPGTPPIVISQYSA